MVTIQIPFIWVEVEDGVHRLKPTSIKGSPGIASVYDWYDGYSYSIDGHPKTYPVEPSIEKAKQKVEEILMREKP